MKRLLYLAALSMVAVLMLAPAAMAQSRGPSGADGTFNCPDFDFQEDAQAVYDANTSDPNGLDGPVGEASTGVPGVACEELPSRGTQQAPAPQPTPTPTPTETTTTPQSEPQEQTQPQQKAQSQSLPNTGGLSLLLPASVLIVSSGILGLAVVRRRNQ